MQQEVNFVIGWKEGTFFWSASPHGTAHHQATKNEWAARHRQALTAGHSHGGVLGDREFERLLEACKDLPALRGVKERFICLLGGRLGLNAGEIAHFYSGENLRM